MKVGYENYNMTESKRVYITHDSRKDVVEVSEGEEAPPTIWCPVDLKAIPRLNKCCLKFVNIMVQHLEGYVPDTLCGYISVKSHSYMEPFARNKYVNNSGPPNPWVLHYPLIEPGLNKLQTNVCYSIDWQTDETIKVALCDKDLVPIPVEALVFTLEVIYDPAKETF